MVKIVQKRNGRDLNLGLQIWFVMTNIWKP
jgi:hypothetical protein